MLPVAPNSWTCDPPSSHALADATDGGSREMRATTMTDAAPGTQTLGHPSPIPDFFMKLGPTTPQQALTVDVVVDAAVKQSADFSSLLSLSLLHSHCYCTRATGLKAEQEPVNC